MAKIEKLPTVFLETSLCDQKTVWDVDKTKFG